VVAAPCNRAKDPHALPGRTRPPPLSHRGRKALVHQSTDATALSLRSTAAPSIAKLLAGEVARPELVLGGLRLWQLSLGMVLFTAVMVRDIFEFGLKMRRAYLPDAFGPQGRIVLLLPGGLIGPGLDPGEPPSVRAAWLNHAGARRGRSRPSSSQDGASKASQGTAPDLTPSKPDLFLPWLAVSDGISRSHDGDSKLRNENAGLPQDVVVPRDEHISFREHMSEEMADVGSAVHLFSAIGIGGWKNKLEKFVVDFPLFLGGPKIGIPLGDTPLRDRADSWSLTNGQRIQPTAQISLRHIHREPRYHSYLANALIVQAHQRCRVLVVLSA
jgi:hypothetical protein